MKKPALVPDWKQSWRWFSMQAHGLIVAMGFMWALIPEDARSPELVYWSGIVFGAVALLGAVGRVVDQNGGGDAGTGGA